VGGKTQSQGVGPPIASPLPGVWTFFVSKRQIGM
jgi:hypothetical protein